MGLATIIRKEKIKQSEFRILILGLDNAGKSSVLDKWIRTYESSLPANCICPTFGFEIKTLSVPNHGVDSQPLRLNFWDIGGQKTIRPFWRNYYEETDAIVWVIDSTDQERMGDCKAELESVLNADRLMGASLLVLANKQDSASALSIDKIKASLGLANLDGKHHHWAVFGTSAVSGFNIPQSLNWLVSELNAVRFGRSSIES